MDIPAKGWVHLNDMYESYSFQRFMFRNRVVSGRWGWELGATKDAPIEAIALGWEMADDESWFGEKEGYKKGDIVLDWVNPHVPQNLPKFIWKEGRLTSILYPIF